MIRAQVPRADDSELSRALKGFLTFCAIALIAIGVAAWWIGPRTLTLAFSDAQRSSPLWVFHFARFRADEATAYTNGYLAGLRELVAVESATELWQGSMVSIAGGRMRDEWQDVVLVQFPTAGGFVRAVTGSEFRRLPAPGPRFERLIVTTQTPPERGLDGLGALVVMLVEVDPGNPVAGAGLAMNVGLFNGRSIWQAPVSVLEIGVPARWNRTVVIGFPSIDDAQAWLSDTQSLTERAIAAARYRGLSTVLVRSP
jgi:hypothetical protein